MICSVCRLLSPLGPACMATCSSARNTSLVTVDVSREQAADLISERINPSTPPVPRVPPTGLDLGDKAQHIVPRAHSRGDES